ncbi:radical SAM protein, partial [Candidatus Woesearchaeota archaeon]|nr:radical SAM protein [Candidatus Woesearchaeota archaeon]
MKSANFMLDYACNQDCLFCLNEWRGKSFGKQLTLEERKKAIDQLIANGIQYLTLSGGEPLLDKDLPAIVDHASEKGLKIMVQTNG